MKTLVEFPRDDKTGIISLRIVLTAESSAEAALLQMAPPMVANINANAHDPDAIEFTVDLNRRE